MVIWLWRPKVKPVLIPVYRDNYSCCCRCSGVWCFRVFKYIEFILLFFLLIATIALWVKDSQTMPNFRRDIFVDNIILSGFLLLSQLFAIISIHCLRPIFIQLHMISANIILSTYIYGCLLYMYQAIRFMITGARSLYSKVYIPNNKTAIETLLGFFLVLVYVIWQMTLTYTYYRWVRDRRLQIDEEEESTKRSARLL